MKKLRTAVLAAVVLILIAGIMLSVIYRKNHVGKSSYDLSDEELKRCGVSITDMNVEQMGDIPSLQELENNSQEILFVMPVQRELRGNDVLVSARVTRVIQTRSGLTENETIWIYEPYSVRWDINYPEGSKGLVYNAHTSPMCLNEEYIVFLCRREISDLYKYSEKDNRTFFYTNKEAGGISLKEREAVLKIRRVPSSQSDVFRYTQGWSEERINAYIRERVSAYKREEYLWYKLENYSFITDDLWGFVPDDSAAAKLTELVSQLRQKYIE